MDITKYSQKLINVIKYANQIAIKRNNVEVTDLHIFLSILEKDSLIIQTYFKDIEISYQDIKDGFDKAIDKLRSAKGISSLYTSRSYQRALLISEEISRNQFEEKIKIEHMLLALLREEDMPSAKLAREYKLDYKNLNKIIAKKTNDYLIKGIDQETIINLEKYGTVLTKKALEGKLDPVIGREEETRDTIRVLSRRIKNNPVLIGEAGVGKTAIVEGIVQRIAEGDVPDNLKDKIVFSMDMTALIAGAKYRGDYEERLKKILDIIIESKEKIILFIDEIHNIIGPSSSSSSMDTANILKPMLARGEILTIGATTIEEYRKYIEKDKALDRRFQKILIEEVDIDSSIAILRGLKSKYENYHLVRITDPAITESVKLSKRFLTDRKLPDVAIDVIDEACALVKMARDQKPEELDSLHRDIIKLTMEDINLKNENDSLSSHRRIIKKEKIKSLEKELEEKTKSYNKEKNRQADILKLERELFLNKLDIEHAKEKRDFKALDKLSKNEKIINDKLYKLNNTKAYYPIKTKVTINEVKEIISKFSGMPKSKLESDRLNNIEEIRKNIKKDFLGSKDEIDKIINTFIISNSGIFKKDKPALSLILRGESGCGKTYLAKLISKYLYDGDKSFISFDMSEFTDKSSITKLIGAPPGYIGYETGGVLTELLRTKPYSVIVFENIENAHKEIQNLILGIVQDGMVKDNKGRDINMRGASLILTSTKINDAFKADFYKFVDYEFILKCLDIDNIKKMIYLRLDNLKEELIDKEIILEYDEDFINNFTKLVRDNKLNLREINRIIDNDIYFLICKNIILGNSKGFYKINLYIDENNEFIIRKKGEQNGI